MNIPDITAKECEKSTVEGRPCRACTFMNFISSEGRKQKQIRHTLEDIAEMNHHKEKLLEQLRRRCR